MHDRLVGHGAHDSRCAGRKQAPVAARPQFSPWKEPSLPRGFSVQRMHHPRREIDIHPVVPSSPISRTLPFSLSRLPGDGLRRLVRRPHFFDPIRRHLHLHKLTIVVNSVDATVVGKEEVHDGRCIAADFFRRTEVITVHRLNDAKSVAKGPWINAGLHHFAQHDNIAGYVWQGCRGGLPWWQVLRLALVSTASARA